MNNPALLEITSILNDPMLTTKVKRALLRDKLKLSETSIDELCPRDAYPGQTLCIHGDPSPMTCRACQQNRGGRP
jgi:hypothetical protein